MKISDVIRKKLAPLVGVEVASEILASYKNVNIRLPYCGEGWYESDLAKWAGVRFYRMSADELGYARSIKNGKSLINRYNEYAYFASVEELPLKKLQKLAKSKFKLRPIEELHMEQL